MSNARVIAVSRKATHGPDKPNFEVIQLIIVDHFTIVLTYINHKPCPVTPTRVMVQPKFGSG